MKVDPARLHRLDETQLGEIAHLWPLWARDAQLPPRGDWTSWLILGGRGSGKTRAGAEWVRNLASRGIGPIALVGQTIAEAMAVMVRGESGVLRVTPIAERPKLRGHDLLWPNGVVGTVLSASEPERFRGPQFAAAWCDELGCGAVDKGANQPNVFADPKSAENARPYFSNGAPDPLMQRQVLRAALDHWNGSPMVERAYLWTWDARPWPAFPQDIASWSDGPNHQTGHWLTGRLGGMASDELARAIVADYGVELDAVAVLPPFVHGYVVDAIVSCRDALTPLLEASGLAVADGPEGLSLVRTNGREALTINDVVAEEGPLQSRRRPDPSEAVGRVALGYADHERDYLTGSVTALRDAEGVIAGVNSALVLDVAGARAVAERVLLDHTAPRDTLELVLPPSLAALEVGDAISVAGQGDGPFEIVEIRDGLARRVTAQAIPPVLDAAIASDQPSPGDPLWAVAAEPVVAIAHLPPLPDVPAQSRLVLAASARPWPGDVTIKDEATGATLARLSRRASVGELVTPLGAGGGYRWDAHSVLTVKLYTGHLASRDDDEVLAGANRIAVLNDAGDWEVIGFAEAELVAPATYELAHLLRGQMGTDDAIGTASAGNRMVVLDDAVTSLSPSAAWLGSTRTLRAFAGPNDASGETFDLALDLDPLLPLAPVHLKAKRIAGGDIELRWMRRSRADSDSWVPDDAPLEHVPEGWRVTILDGATPVRSIDAGASTATYSAAQQVADFGAPPAGFAFAVAQKSPLYGPGHAAEGQFDE